MTAKGPGAADAPEAAGEARTAGIASIEIAVLARIPYLNAEPFYVNWEGAPGATVDLPPRALGEEARAGRADAGLMAVADWFALSDTFERVGDLGIACEGAVQSVLLFSRRHVGELSGATVDLTSESSTSAALTRILLAAKYGLRDVRYRRRPVESQAPTELDGDAWLLIGDAALRARAEHEAGDGRAEYMLDLGEAWHSWTGLPFVYAVWAVRKSLPAAEREHLRGFLDASLAIGEQDLPGIAQYYARERTSLGTAAELARYLEAFRYRLGPKEESGLSHFKSLWEEYCVDA